MWHMKEGELQRAFAALMAFCLVVFCLPQNAYSADLVSGYINNFDMIGEKNGKPDLNWSFYKNISSNVDEPILSNLVTDSDGAVIIIGNIPKVEKEQSHNSSIFFYKFYFLLAVSMCFVMGLLELAFLL